jgi:hypothetical protein
VAGERSADEIQRDIEAARVSLAGAVDEIAYRTNPKRVGDSVKKTLREKAATPQGQAIIAGTGLVVVVLVVRRFRKR